jgi:hypothetical protein
VSRAGLGGRPSPIKERKASQEGEGASIQDSLTQIPSGVLDACVPPHAKRLRRRPALRYVTYIHLRVAIAPPSLAVSPYARPYSVDSLPDPRDISAASRPTLEVVVRMVVGLCDKRCELRRCQRRRDERLRAHRARYKRTPRRTGGC